MNKSGVLAGITLGLFAAVVLAQTLASANYQPGQQVEVREGDEWSSATILKKEGRKYQIRYATGGEGSEEWVTTDRIRVGGASTTAPANGAATKTPTMTFKIGDHVETKWGGRWDKTTVKGKSPLGWILVSYDGERRMEWVQPWRVRAIGSTMDVPYARPNQPIYKPGPAPKEPPDAMPQDEKFGKQSDANQSAQVAMTDANVAGAQEVVIGSVGGWALAADPALSGKPVSSQPIAFKGGVGDVFDKVSNPVFASQASQAVVVHKNEFKKDRVALERLNLGGATSVGVLDMPVLVAACDLSDDGTTVLARSDIFGVGQKARLDLWTIDSTSPKHVISFMPYGDKKETERDIAWARIVGLDRAITQSNLGRLIAWDTKTARAIWAAEASTVVPAMSGGKKQIAVVVESQLAVIDPASGKTLASMPLPGAVRQGMLSFRPDGKQLALASDQVLRVWDATNGTLVAEVPFDGPPAEAIDWPNDGFVLVNGTTLIDLAKKITLWDYHGVKSSGTFAGRFWYVAQTDNSGQKLGMASMILPSDETKRAAANIKPDEIWAAKPGDSISLDTGGLPGDIAAKANAALRQKLEANGFKVAEGSSVRLVASVEAGKPVEIRYRKIGAVPFGGSTSINATPQTMKLTFFDSAGKALWQRQRIKSPPGILMLKEGQTTESAVAEATKPDASLYESVALPTHVTKAEYRGGLGVSSLTAHGETVLSQRAR